MADEDEKKALPALPAGRAQSKVWTPKPEGKPSSL
jgi:hypothetical protein